MIASATGNLDSLMAKADQSDQSALPFSSVSRSDGGDHDPVPSWTMHPGASHWDAGHRAMLPTVLNSIDVDDWE